MLPNAPKHYETHHNMSLESDAVDWADLLKEFYCNFVAWTFALIAIVRMIWTEYRKATKRSQMHSNTTKQNKTWI